jgi:hypothetical protein
MSRSYRQYKARAAMAGRELERSETEGDRQFWSEALRFSEWRMASERDDAMRMHARRKGLQVQDEAA